MRKFILYCRYCILVSRTLSSGSYAAALDKEYVSARFLATSKGWFLVVFVSGVALVLFPTNNCCNFQRSVMNTSYI